ncbi:secreted protein containing a PDZ domain-like protein [Stackebrandtia nassauensis DSM 44728]|uniref:endopeptidase La n=2 Tax=Stackebrandtia TaxID=283810 RepID=D3Q3V8_STANL|nr:secreted protein containing a PDZ domain-like protein [Stackebrandtia nassauensis DSM 44728]
MRRRGLTVLIGAILVSVMTWQALSMRVAYVGLGPGPTYDALAEYTFKDDDGKKKTVELISADEKYSSKSKGQLRLVTVRIHDDIELARALYYWLSDDYAVVPRELQFPEDKSDEEIAAEQEEMWENSQAAAETAALRELGEEVEVTVTKVDSDSPSKGDLKRDDVITAVDGEEVTSQERLAELLAAAAAKAPGEAVKLTVDRDGKDKKVKVTPEENSQGVAILPGVDVEPKQKDPYGLKVTAEGLNVGGPSAGLIFALAMVDRVSKEDLTGGADIIGTGEIDEDGNVGAIGGIAQKVVAASQQGAKVFLTPADNCAAAKANVPDGLKLIKVSTLDGALKELETLREGGEPTTCLT